MSGYPKIWTRIRREPWFIELSGTERGIYLQMLLMARDAKNDGEFSAKSWRDLARELGVDRGTLARLWSKITPKSKVIVVEKSARVLRLKIVNYTKWQSFRSQNEADQGRRNVGEKSATYKNNTNVLFSAEGGLGFQPPASAWITDCPKERWKWIERKLAMPDSEYLKLFRRCVMEIDKIYVPGTIPKLERYKPGVVKKLIEIENRLDMIWTKAQGGKDVMPEFRDAVNDYYRFWKGNF